MSRPIESAELDRSFEEFESLKRTTQKSSAMPSLRTRSQCDIESVKVSETGNTGRASPLVKRRESPSGLLQRLWSLGPAEPKAHERRWDGVNDPDTGNAD